jgi:hypothetical protein
MAYVYNVGQNTLTRKPSHIIIARTKPFFRPDDRSNSNKCLLRLNDFRTWGGAKDMCYQIVRYRLGWWFLPTPSCWRPPYWEWCARDGLCVFYPSCAAVNRFSGNWIKFSLLFGARELEVSLQYKHTCYTVHMNWTGNMYLLHIGYGWSCPYRLIQDRYRPSLLSYCLLFLYLFLSLGRA